MGTCGDKKINGVFFPDNSETLSYDEATPPYIMDSQILKTILVYKKKYLNVLSTKSTVVLQWIPAHSGITGNDELAKEGRKMAQTETCLLYREA